MTIQPRFFCFAATLGLALAATASGDQASSARLHEELRLIESGQFAGTAAQNIAFTLDAPAQRVTTLGLLVNSASAKRAKRGLLVLGVTPGSSAQLSSVTLPSIHLRVGREELLAAGGATVDVAPHDESTPPRSDTCGHVNVFDVAPRSNDLHAVKLLSIDGRLPGATGTVSFRLSPGLHTLKLAEQIEPRYLAFNSRQRGDSVKEMSLDVAPGVTYFLAAQLHEDKRADWHDGAYWDPVLWKQTEESCR